MTDESQPPGILPIRARPPRPRGRHRRPEPAYLPSDAPALVLAAPRPAGSVAPTVTEEIATLVRTAHPDVDLWVGHLDGDSGDSGDIGTVARSLADSRPTGRPAAVVVPLVTGPHAQIYDNIYSAVADRSAVITDPLGPHPMLAEALHVRLAEKGLARADRIRLLSITTAVDGVIVATVGGHEAAKAAEITAVLLAARLAMPVVPASLDDVPDIEAAATHLRGAGSTRLAVAPYLVGPEADRGRMEQAAAAAGAGCAEPIGTHHSVVRIAALRYEMALQDLGMGRVPRDVDPDLDPDTGGGESPPTGRKARRAGEHVAQRSAPPEPRSDQQRTAQQRTAQQRTAQQQRSANDNDASIDWAADDGRKETP